MRLPDVVRPFFRFPSHVKKRKRKACEREHQKGPRPFSAASLTMPFPTSQQGPPANLLAEKGRRFPRFERFPSILVGPQTGRPATLPGRATGRTDGRRLRASVNKHVRGAGSGAHFCVSPVFFSFFFSLSLAATLAVRIPFSRFGIWRSKKTSWTLQDFLV